MSSTELGQSWPQAQDNVCQALSELALQASSPLYPSTHGTIIDRIIELSPRPTLLSFRFVSKRCCKLADRVLATNLKVCTRDDTPELVISSTCGRLPSFFTRRDKIIVRWNEEGVTEDLDNGYFALHVDNTTNFKFWMAPDVVEWFKSTIAAAKLVINDGPFSIDNTIHDGKPSSSATVHPVAVPEAQVIIDCYDNRRALWAFRAPYGVVDFTLPLSIPFEDIEDAWQADVTFPTDMETCDIVLHIDTQRTMEVFETRMLGLPTMLYPPTLKRFRVIWRLDEGKERTSTDLPTIRSIVICYLMDRLFQYVGRDVHWTVVGLESFRISVYNSEDIEDGETLKDIHFGKCLMLGLFFNLLSRIVEDSPRSTGDMTDGDIDNILQHVDFAPLDSVAE